MPKAVLSHRIYLDIELGDPLFEKIRESLTHKIYPEYKDTRPYEICTFKRLRDGLISIPAGREDLIPDNYEIVDKRVDEEIDFPEFKFSLRDSQQEIYDSVDSNCIINARVGWGKTFTALAIAAKLKRKTLILVHTSTLLNQWKDEVEKAFGIVPSIIGQTKFQTSGPIVLGMVQTVTKKATDLSKLFGLVIMDEVHHAPSDTFSSIVDKMYAKYKIGVSGTLVRKDQKHVLIYDYFSKKVFTPPKENTLDPEVHLFDSGIRLSDVSHVPWATKVTKLLENEDYRNLILALARKYSSAGHKVLIVADRVQFLEFCAKELGAACITGQTKDLQRKKEIDKLLSNKTNILCGSQKIFTEGVSINSLSCVIPATPINNDSLLDQLSGRIMRISEGKNSPVLIDLALSGNTGKKQRQNRLSFYGKQGWKVWHK